MGSIASVLPTRDEAKEVQFVLLMAHEENI
jgi:hypothetical protein